MKSKRIGLSQRKHGDFVTALYLNHLNTRNIHFTRVLITDKRLSYGNPSVDPSVRQVVLFWLNDCIFTKLIHWKIDP